MTDKILNVIEKIFYYISFSVCFILTLFALSLILINADMAFLSFFIFCPLALFAWGEFLSFE